MLKFKAPAFILRLSLILAFVIAGANLAGAEAVLPTELASMEALRGKAVSVVVFLSPLCPCSKSHEKTFKELVKQFPSVGFIGIHANRNEPAAESRAYFAKNPLGFEVLEQPKAAWLTALPALKTPHVFVFSGAEHTLRYQGGVDDSHTVENASKFYLKDVLEDLTAGQNVRWIQTRVLGCAISREGEGS